MPRLRPRVARLLLAVARSTLGGRVAAFACARLPRLLPVDRLALTPHVIAFRHPRPEARDHVVLVLRRHVPSLPALLRSGRHDLLLRLVEAARDLDDGGVPGERTLAVNMGGRQEVAQLHAHLLPVAALRRSIDEVIAERRVPLGDPNALRRALRELTDRIDEAGGPWGGSLLVLDLDAAGSDAGSAACLRLAATVTPEDQRMP